MKILVITGSPNPEGTSALLAERFISGAEASGHTVIRFDAAQEEIAPCRVCRSCRKDRGKCVFTDSMDSLKKEMLDADVVVFASPTWYFGVSSHMKLVLDRMYAIDSELHRPMKAVIMLTCADKRKEALAGSIQSFQSIIGYLGWEMAGLVAAAGCFARADIEKTRFPELAYQLGENI